MLKETAIREIIKCLVEYELVDANIEQDNSREEVKMALVFTKPKEEKDI